MIKIRTAQVNDREKIAGFQVLMAKETENIDLDWETVSRGVNAVFDQPTLGQYYVAEVDGRIVASLMITFEWSDWRNQMVWWFQSVYVLTEYRKHGVFRKMYQYIKNQVEQNNQVSGLRLYVDKSNSSAQQVYKALGMDGDHYRVFEQMKEF